MNWNVSKTIPDKFHSINLVFLNVLYLLVYWFTVIIQDEHCHYHQHKSAIEHLQEHSVDLLTTLGIKGSRLQEVMHKLIKYLVLVLNEKQGDAAAFEIFGNTS